MDALLAEMSRKKSTLASKGATISRRDLKSEEEQRRAAEQRERDERRKRKRAQREEEEAAAERERQEAREREARRWGRAPVAVAGEDGAPPAAAEAPGSPRLQADGSASSLAAGAAPSAADVTAMLRGLGAPIALFGEAEDQRLARLRALERRQDIEGAGDFRLGAGYEIKNAMMDGEVPGGGAGEASTRDPGADVAPAAGAASASAAAGGAGAAPAPRPRLITSDFSKQGLKPHKCVRRFLKYMLEQWELDLGAAEERAREEVQWKAEAKMFRQCKDYLSPLLKLLRKEELNGAILDALVDIVRHCEEGDFRAAADDYIGIAIGNAAWPIGLTMVGIHERTGREKISSKNVAHVMNNELQRKYLTSVRRLMNYAQSRRPDVPPSMKVQS